MAKAPKTYAMAPRLYTRYVPGKGLVISSSQDELDRLAPEPTAAPTGKRDAFGAGFEAAKTGLGTGLPYAVQKVTDSLYPENERRYQQQLQASAAKQEQLLPGGPAGFGQGASLGRIVGENLAYSAPQMGAQALGGVAGFAAGGPVGAGLGVGAVGAPMYVGSNVARATEGGQTALTGGQAARSFAASIPQAAVDVLGARFLPGVGKYLGEGGFTGNILSRAAKGTAAGAITEGGGESLQQVGERYAAGLDLSGQEALSEYGQAAAIGGLLGGGFGAIGGATNTTKLKEQRAAEALAAGRPANLLNPTAPGELDLQGGTYNEKAGPAARKAVNLEDNVRSHLNLGEDENVDEVVKSLQDQRRAIVSAAQDAQAKGDQASFYKFTDALAAHDNQYFKSSDPDVIAQRADLVQNVEAAQTAAASAEGRKGKRAAAKLASATAELSRFDRTKNISPVQEYINVQQKEAARSTQTDLLSNVGRTSNKPINEQVPEGAQYDLFGGPAVAPEAIEGEVARTDVGGQLPLETSGTTPLFDRRPTSTVALDFTPRNIARNLIGTQPLKGNPKGYTTTLAARMAPLFQSGDVKGLAELLSSELDKKSQLTTVDQYMPILRRAKAMATDFANRAETAKREEINIRAQEGQARSTGGVEVGGAPTMQDAVSIARNRDQNAQAAAGEQAQAQQAAAQEQAVIQQAQANQAQAAQVAENSKRNQILTNVLRNPDIDNYYNAFEEQLSDLGMNPAVSDDELAAINAAKNAQERRAAGREVFTATEADVITEELQNAFNKIEATTQSGTAERVIAKRNATMEAITKAVDLVGAAETDALEAIEKLVGKTSYKQAEQSWQKMMAAKEEALNAPTETAPMQAAAEPEAQPEAQPEALVAKEAAVEPTVVGAAPVTTETTNAAQEGEQPQRRTRQRKGANEVGTPAEASSSNSTEPVAETAEEVAKPKVTRAKPSAPRVIKAATEKPTAPSKRPALPKDKKAATVATAAAESADAKEIEQEAKENFWRTAELELTGPEGLELNAIVLDLDTSLQDVKNAFEAIKERAANAPTKTLVVESVQPTVVKKTIEGTRGTLLKEIGQQKAVYNKWGKPRLTTSEAESLLETVESATSQAALDAARNAMEAAIESNRNARPSRTSVNPNIMALALTRLKVKPTATISTAEQTVQNDNIHDQLTDDEKTTLAEEYNEPTYNDKAKAQFAQDVIDTINNTGRKISAVIAEIIKRIQGAVISAAIVFNPMALQAVSVKVPTAIASTIKTETNITAVPKDAAAKMSANAQYVYEVSAATAKSLNKGFFIADKPNGVIHVFDKTGKMIASGPALFGMSSGDMPTGRSALTSERTEDKVTPAGTFTLLAAKNAEYTGGYTLKLKETAEDGGVIAIHSVYTGEASENREGRLASKTAADNKISFGCINTSAKMFLTNVLPTINEFDGGLAFVLPDKVENTKTLFKAEAPAKPAQFLQKTKVQPLADNAKQVAERAAVEAKFRAELDRLGVSKAGLRILTQLEGRAEYGRDVGGEYSPAKKLITVVMQPNSKGEYSLGHEAIHAMEHFGLILPQEKAAVLAWAKGQREIRDFIKSQYGEESQDIQNSEYVAEAYALWLKREAEFPGRVNLFFRKLNGFLGAFKNYLFGRGFISADAVLEAVDSGFFTQRQQSKATLGQTSKSFFRESTASQEYAKANDRVREYVGGYGNSIAAAMVIANKLTDMAVRAGIPAARTMERLLADQGRITARLDRKIEDLSERFDGLKNAVEKGVGEGSVNNVIQKIRFAKKWGFDPMYKDADGKKINVDVDPELNKLFNKLSPEAQQVVKDVFQLSRDNLYAKKEAVMRTIGSEYDALIKSTRDDLKNATGERAIKLAREVKNLEAKKSRQLTRYESLLRIDPNTPYAPIKRFGDFVVVGRSKEYVAAEQKAAREKTPEAYAELRKMQEDGEHYYVAYADDRWKAILLRDKIAQVYDAPDMFRKDEASEAQIGGSEIYAAFQRMQKMIQEQGDSMDPKMRKSLTALATDLYLGTLAESSSRKAEMAARLVHGGDFDMVRGAIAQGRSDARFIGSIEKNGEIADAITQMKKEAKAGGTNTDQARELVNQITARHAANLAPAPQNKTIDKILSFTTAMYLTTSPMFFVQQAVQPLMVSVPVAAAKHGYGRTMDALNTGYDVVRQAWGDADITKPLDLDKLKGVVWAVAQVIADSNALDVAIDKDMGNWTSEANGPIGSAMTNVSKKLGGWTRKLEAINRLSTGVMMFVLEMGKTTGQNVDPEAYKSYVEDFKKTHPEGATEERPMLSEQQYVATQEAIRLIMDTHGDYSLKASPLFMRSGAGRVLSQFKKFQIMQLSLYTQAINDGFFAKDIPAAEKEIARRTLLYMTGHAALFAGALGLPGAAAGEWLWELINKLMGREGPFTAEGDLRKAIGNPTIANLLINGAPTLAGVDLSGSLGQGNLLSIAPYAEIPRDEATTADAIIRMLGPAIGGVALDYGKALGFMNDGQYYKGLEKMMPKGFSNAIKAYRESTEGVTDKGGETTVGAKDIGIGATVATALGLRTTEVSSRQYRQGAAIETKQYFQDKTSTLKREYIKAYDKKDGAKMQELRVKWIDLQKMRIENGLTRQPIIDLMNAPRQLAKREQNVLGGVKTSKSNRALAEQLAEETGFVEPEEE